MKNKEHRRKTIMYIFLSSEEDTVCYLGFCSDWEYILLSQGYFPYDSESISNYPFLSVLEFLSCKGFNARQWNWNNVNRDLGLIIRCLMFFLKPVLLGLKRELEKGGVLCLNRIFQSLPRAQSDWANLKRRSKEVTSLVGPSNEAELAEALDSPFHRSIGGNKHVQLRKSDLITFFLSHQQPQDNSFKLFYHQ